MNGIAYIENLAARGRYHFTRAEAEEGLGRSSRAVGEVLGRLKRKGLVASPYRGFFVVLAPEHRRRGCAPADHFIPQLMKYLGRTYYVALLSAAEIHGAAHQRPQVYQVVTDQHVRRLRCGELRVDFVSRFNAAEVPVEEVKTPRGYLRVSTPEATALDLVGHPHVSGGLNNVSTILAELGEKLTSEGFLSAAKVAPMAWVQRLGHLMDYVGVGERADALARYVARKQPLITPLDAGKPLTQAPRDMRWRVATNVEVEADL